MRRENVDGVGSAAPAKILRAVVAAASSVIGEGLRSVLADLRIEVAGLADSCAGALAQAAELAPDLIFVEARALPQTPVMDMPAEAPLIVLGLHDEPAAVARAVDVGACAYLRRDLTPPCLRLAVEAARCGYVLIERTSLGDLAPRTPAEAPELTPREREVLALLVRGLSYGAVARALNLSTATVRTHMRRICAKTGAGSRLEAVRWAMAHGFAER